MCIYMQCINKFFGIIIFKRRSFILSKEIMFEFFYFYLFMFLCIFLIRVLDFNFISQRIRRVNTSCYIKYLFTHGWSNKFN